MTSKIRKTPFFTGLFLLCMSTLMLQIVETRILSVVSMYYLAFFSISMAMLGMTAGALLVYFKFSQVNADNLAPYLSKLSLGFSLVLVICFLLQLASPVPTVQWATFVVIWINMILLLAAPFVLAGAAVSLALTRSPFPVGITYGVDLGGAAFGCVAVLVLMNVIDSPSAIFVVAALPAVAASCFTLAGKDLPPVRIAPDWKFLRRPSWIAVGLVVLAAANATTYFGLQPVSAKFGSIEDLRRFDFIRWNSFSRIAVTEPRIAQPFLWGPSPILPPGLLAQQRSLNIDGFAGTSMPLYGGDDTQVDALRYDITNLAYSARHTGRAAVIGVGSGRDLLSAHLFGFRDITGVELNPIFVNLLTDPTQLRSYAGVADLPGVRLIVDEGRSWFARTDERFDTLEMSMIDTFAATGAGAFSLSENGLYTVEAWRTFLNALKPDGLFTVSRWYSPTANVEIGRTTSLAVASLISLGVERPRDHIFLAATGNLATLVISRAPFTADDLKALTDAAQRLRFEILASPDRTTSVPVIQDLLAAKTLADLDARSQQYLLDVSPPTDSRPFFFNQLRLFHPEDLRQIYYEYERNKKVISGSGLV